MKMAKKSVVNRIKVTKTGKLIRRKMGLSHFRAKKSAKQFYRKYTKAITASTSDQKVLIKKYGIR